MTPTVGKRAANKLATRQALQHAADELFADRGYAATTVRDIAEAAGVTERTFFRYFASKEELILDDVLAWLPLLAAQICARPAAEPPLVAVGRAVLDLAGGLGSPLHPSPAWLFTDGPPAGRLGRTGPRPLLAVEQTISDAIRIRLTSTRTPPEDVDFTADVWGRCAVAALRSAAIRDWQLRTRGTTPAPSLGDLVRQAFAMLATT
jgi:AcrR family transcriptional regulator